MKVVVLASAPLLERHAHKLRVLDGVIAACGKPSDVLVVFDRTGVLEQLGIVLAQGGIAAAARKALGMWRRDTATSAARPAGQGGALRTAARQRGCVVVEVARLADALGAIASHAPDLGVNLGLSFVPEAVLDAPRLGVLGVHYATLPRLRGGDTIRWSVLLGAPLQVCVTRLEMLVDRGLIVARRPVIAEPGDDVEALRVRFQREGASAMVDAVAAVAASGSLVGESQSADGGSTFYRMGRYLRSVVDDKLADGEIPVSGGAA